MSIQEKETIQPRCTFLWLTQVCLACGIVGWLINPVSENIYVLAMMMIIWMGIAYLRGARSLSIVFLKKWYAWVYLWILIMFLYSCVGHTTFSLSYVMYLFCFGVGAYYIVNNDIRAAKVISVFCIVYFLIMAVVTLKAYSVVPGLSRILANGDKAVVIERGGGDFITPFVAGYGAIYGFAELAIVMLFSVFKNVNNRFLKTILLGGAVFLIYVVVKAEYLVAVILILMGLVFLLISKMTSPPKKMVLTCVFLFAMLIFLLCGQYIFLWLADTINISNFSIRLREIAMLFGGNGYASGTDAGERLSLYGISISNFLEAPIFGKGTGVLFQTFGNHSTILDAFAKYGLVGGISLLIFYINPMRNISLKFSGSNKKGYSILIGIIGVLAIINVADTRVNYALVYIVCPLLLYWTEFVSVDKKRNISEL